jgi:hypothetical protein
MIMVQLTSPEIDQVGGIWAGMSGSPVYAADGRIIGAVSYGLAFGPSPVAGVTPAQDMKDLIGACASPATLRTLAGTRHVALPSRMQQRLVTAGLATPAEASAGLQRLPLPVSVSGMADNARLDKAASLMRLSDVRLYRGGAAAATADTTPAEQVIFPGSNLAASMSYGDVSVVATGTTTMVCGNQVLGFGHPFNWTGDTSLTLHGANAIYIQKDPTMAGFKVSNATDPVGVITGDHMAGISGLRGYDEVPDTTLVHTTVRVTTTAASRTADTHISVPDFLPDLATMAEVANQDRVFDRLGGGSSLVQFIASGTTARGEPFALARTNRFADAWDISYGSVPELYNDISALLGNNFTGVTISDVTVKAWLNPVNRFFSVGKVERNVNGSFVKLTNSSVIKARAGGTVHLRVTLNSPRNAFGSKVVLLSVKVPPARAGLSGTLAVGQLGQGGFGTSGPAPTSFAGLVNKLANAPRNDQLQAELDVYRNNGSTARSGTAKLIYDVVHGIRTFQFRVIR